MSTVLKPPVTPAFLHRSSMSETSRWDSKTAMRVFSPSSMLCRSVSTQPVSDSLKRYIFHLATDEGCFAAMGGDTKDSFDYGSYIQNCNQPPVSMQEMHRMLLDVVLRPIRWYARFTIHSNSCSGRMYCGCGRIV